MEKSNLIIITGPECSGKTTLMQSLCATKGIIGVEEYARAYLKYLTVPYTPSDLVHIAEAQTSQILHAQKTTPNLVISDTGPEVVEIWYAEKFGAPPKSISQLSKKLPTAHYLLCKPDLPWEEDPLRENPHDRDRLFSSYLQFLEQRKYSYTIVCGQNRKEISLEVVQKFLPSQPDN